MFDTLYLRALSQIGNLLDDDNDDDDDIFISHNTRRYIIRWLHCLYLCYQKEFELKRNKWLLNQAINRGQA